MPTADKQLWIEEKKESFTFLHLHCAFSVSMKVLRPFNKTIFLKAFKKG